MYSKGIYVTFSVYSLILCGKCFLGPSKYGENDFVLIAAQCYQLIFTYIKGFRCPCMLLQFSVVPFFGNSKVKQCLFAV